MISHSSYRCWYYPHNVCILNGVGVDGEHGVTHAEQFHTVCAHVELVDGTVQHQGTLNKALRRIIRDCNYDILDENQGEEVTLLPKFSNHSLRHTFTTRMCEAGVNIKAMQEILGHSDIQTTMDIYAEASKDLMKKELINFEEYFIRQKEAQENN